MGSESSEKQPHQKGSGGGVGGGCERTEQEEQTEAFKITTLEQRQSVQVLLLRIADLGSAMQPFSVFGNLLFLTFSGNRMCYQLCMVDCIEILT